MGRDRRLAERGLEGPRPSRSHPPAKRYALVAGYVAPCEPPRDPGPEQHINVDRPGELVGIDCFYVGRRRGTEGAIWQLSAIDIAPTFRWAKLVVARQGNPTAAQTSKLVRRVAADLSAAGWRLERLLSDNGNEFKGEFSATVERLGPLQTRIHAGRPQTNGNVEVLHKTILDECWQPAFDRTPILGPPPVRAMDCSHGSG